MKLVAIDPGDVHCGVAYFEAGEFEHGWACVDTAEYSPDDLTDGLAEALVDGEFDVVVLESFHLYGDKALAQTGSEMMTAQVIGAVRWLVRNHNAHARRHLDAEAAGKMLTCELAGGTCADRVPQAVRFAMQPADIQTPAKAILRARGIKSKAKQQKTGVHTFSAELHGWKWILDEAGRRG